MTHSPAWRRLRVRLLAAALVLGMAAGGLVASSDLLRDAELATVDARFELRGAREAPRDVAVVAIDTGTLTAFGTFPFSRLRHAEMLDRLRALGVRRVVYDVQFTEQSGDVEADNALVEAAARAPGTIFAVSEVGDGGSTNLFGGGAGLRASRGVPATPDLPADPGQRIRRGTLEVQGLPSLAARVASERRGRPLRAADAGSAQPWIDFAGPAGTVLTVPFAAVLDRAPAARALRDRIVVVGATAPTLKDVFATSVGGPPMSGAEVQANAIATLLAGGPLRDGPGRLTWLLLFAAALIPVAAAAWRGALAAALAGAAVLALWPAAAYLAFRGGHVLEVMPPLVAGGLATLGAVAAASTIESVQREWTRSVFGRFVSDEVADMALRAGGDEPRLPAVRMDATVLVCDLRGFTTFSEAVEPEDGIEILDGYLRAASEAVVRHGGTITSYLGDGLLAVFGAPLAQPDHADRALTAGREALAAVERENERRGGAGFRMGVGLHSGPLMAGTVGTERRLEYTVIGDTVNTAARLEGRTKDVGAALLLSDATVSALTREHDGLEAVGDLELRGRRAPVAAWRAA